VAAVVLLPTLVTKVLAVLVVAVAVALSELVLLVLPTLAVVVVLQTVVELPTAVVVPVACCKALALHLFLARLTQLRLVAAELVLALEETIHLELAVVAW
jgi:hypothetical protein